MSVIADRTAAPLERVRALEALRMELRPFQRSLVGDARRAGASWAEIGAVLAITRQAAEQRFGISNDEA
jgi:hypothetical protein